MNILTNSIKKPLPSLAQGFTLLELMISIGLGAIVLGGVLAVMYPSVVSWQANAAIAELQDLEQVTHDRIGRSLRQSSSLVCGTRQNNQAITNAATGTTNLTASSQLYWAFNGINNPAIDFLPFQAFDANSTTTLFTSAFNALRLQNTPPASAPTTAANAVGDFFYTLSPDAFSARITNAINNRTSGQNANAAPTLVLDTAGIQANDLLLVHDCFNPVIIKVNAVAGNTITYAVPNGTNLTNTYDFPVHTVVSRYIPTIYYLSRRDQSGTTIAGNPTLYARTIDAASLTPVDTPVAQGVVNMRVQYGVSAPGVPFAYYSPSQLAALGVNTDAPTDNDVTSSDASTVRLTLLIESTTSDRASKQASLIFPAVDGTPSECINNPTADISACPDFIDFSNNRHRVMSFVVARPQPIAIN